MKLNVPPTTQELCWLLWEARHYGDEVSDACWSADPCYGKDVRHPSCVMNSTALALHSFNPEAHNG